MTQSHSPVAGGASPTTAEVLEADEKALKLRRFGEEGAEVHADAINALHRFANLTNCPAGHDVIGWFSHMTGVWQEDCARAYRRALQASGGGE